MSDLNLSIFITKMSDELMGQIIDMLRVTNLGDRQFDQIQRSIKKLFRENNAALIEVIKEAYPEIIKEEIK